MNISKYSGNGNDFLIFHCFSKQDYSKLAKKLCHRSNALGADGLVVLYPHKSLDFEWGFYNSDGSIANMCGNATRCASHYAYNNKLVLDKKVSFLSGAGIINCEIKKKNVVATQFPFVKIIKKEFQEENLTWKIIDTGVPHLVCLNKKDVFCLKIAKKMRDKYNANVNFSFMKNKHLYVRTFERGVEDETLACGTGMAASFFYAKEKKLFKENKIQIISKSKEKILFWKHKKDIFFEAKVKKIYSCDIKV